MQTVSFFIEQNYAIQKELESEDGRFWTYEFKSGVGKTKVFYPEVFGVHVCPGDEIYFFIRLPEQKNSLVYCLGVECGKIAGKSRYIARAVMHFDQGWLIRDVVKSKTDFHLLQGSIQKDDLIFCSQGCFDDHQQAVKMGGRE